MIYIYTFTIVYMYLGRSFELLYHEKSMNACLYIFK